MLFSKFKSLLILLLTLPILIVAQDGKQPSYIGATACGMCHKSEKQGKQLSHWQESLHAQAYKVLQSDEANKISQEKDKKNAVDNPNCLKCHASGWNVDASLLDKKFSIEDGVQCETCHGPGSEYKSLKVMKDPELARKNGLIRPTNIQAFCETCHNAESPTFSSFNFEESWAKIKHPVPT